MKKVGYYDKIVPEYKEIVDDVLTYKSNHEAKKRLLDTTKFNYADKGLQCTYWLKVMMNKL